MGMTIDEAIEYNKNLKMFMEISDKQDTYKFLEENHIALNMAIDTMRKYQKIEEIVKDIPYGGEATVRRIQEVVNWNDD